ncbi:MAG TPA: SDR family oxidoreductase [Flavisolibacter sp.]|jgi:NAD(P)-dependent dehydrogenase (short-subunit alcohol dehydrogenase family)|nr:SDR family oxidoreductase [Flavisolibacter sp.]
MDLELQDKIVVVTGGAKGIGLGIAKLLAAEGATPVIIGRNESDNQKAVDEIKAAGGNAFFVTAELTRPEECSNAVARIIDSHGTIHGLVNNAGVNDGVGLENGSYSAFLESLHKNLVHYYLIAHHALPELKKHKGSIVNISSKTADTGQGGTSAYAASNGGRNALTREWAVELARYSIRVNAVIVAECYTPLYEAWIKTLPNPEEKLAEIVSKIPLEKRFTTVEEIAAMTVFLLSPLSSHTTGQLIYVDGGYVHLDRAMANAV